MKQGYLKINSQFYSEYEFKKRFHGKFKYIFKKRKSVPRYNLLYLHMIQIYLTHFVNIK